MKAVLIALATLVVFDAAAWDSAMRYRLLHEGGRAARTVTSLDWDWA